MASAVLGGRESVQVAVAQLAPRFLDKSRTVERADAAIRRAAADGAELLVFPETFLAGYPYWTEGWDTEVDDWRSARLAFRDAAVEIPSAEIDVVRQAARESGINVVLGCNEIDSRPAVQTIYNSLVLIGSDGRLRGVHRKLMPTFAERLFWGRGDATGLVVHETEIGRVGGLVCGENTMTLARAALISQGEDFHVMLFPGAFSLTRGPRLEEPDDDGSFWGHTAARAHAKEAGCFVVSACGVIADDDIPDDFAFKGRMNIDYAHGGSSIVAPSGVPIVGPELGSTIVHASCDAARIKVSKAVSDTMGHYARPDLLRLLVRSGDSWLRADEVPALRERAKRSADRWEVDDAEVVEAAERAVERDAPRDPASDAG